MRYDSHVHIGPYEDTEKMINESVYKDKYKIYSSIRPSIIKHQTEYIKTFHDFFALPLFFKETDVKKCNSYVIEFCKENGGIPVPLVGENRLFTEHDEEYFVYKEHFLIQDYLDWKERSLYYEHLNDNGGYIIIHCKDRIRKDYIEKLTSQFRNMNIIIAHLGRDTYENPNFILEILNKFKNNDHVMYDISTIHNVANIRNAINTVGYDKLLYGSDFPFEYLCVQDVFNSQRVLSENFDVKRFDNNFERIKKSINGKRKDII